MQWDGDAEFLRNPQTYLVSINIHQTQKIALLSCPSTLRGSEATEWKGGAEGQGEELKLVPATALACLTADFLGCGRLKEGTW